jgi:serine/threonine-protein kinase
MSPEQYQGGSLDGRADVFSLGVCLYEALLGGTLFARDSEFETVAAILFGESPGSVRATRADVPEAIDAIARRAIEKDREARFETAEAMQVELLRYLAAVDGLVRDTDVAELVVALFPERAAEGPKLDRSPMRRTLRDDLIDVRESTGRYELEYMVDSIEMDLGKASRRKERAIAVVCVLLVASALAALGWSLRSSPPADEGTSPIAAPANP